MVPGEGSQSKAPKMAEKELEKDPLDLNEKGPTKATETSVVETAKLPADVQTKLKKLERLEGRFQGRRLPSWVGTRG